METISNDLPAIVINSESMIERPIRSTCAQIRRGFCKAPWRDSSMRDGFHRTTIAEVGGSAIIGLGCLAVRAMDPKMLSVMALFPATKYYVFASRDQLSRWEKVGMGLKILVTSSIAIAAGFSVVYFPFYKHKA